MESDLDSILAAASSSDSDAPSPSFRRTVDDILNEDSSSSSSSITSSPPLPLQISDLNPPRPPSLPPPLPQKLATAASLPGLGLRSHSAPRSLPSLFDRVRPTPRPGAAFAAAAAASRSVLTPHAAAIKSRRAESLGKSVSGVPAEAREETEEIVRSVGIGDAPPEHTVPDHAIETAVEEEELQPEASEVVGHSLHPGIPADTVDGKAGSGLAAVGNAEDDHPAYPDSLPAAVEDGLGLEEKRVEEMEERWTGEGEAGEESSVVKEEEVGSPGGGDLGKTEVAVIEERIPEPERAKSSRKADKKLRASMKPLEWAEELEKRQASSGLHWEEGAAAQPMRLKGIAKDQPAIGYMQCERDNAITRTLSSQVVRGNHGSPLALALHLSFIAIGMSKGSVLVFPSKYSPHSTDSVDSKMLLLGFQSERPLSSVTSLCFNLQGDLLLVGYGNGHVVLWDVLKATAAKVIIGEHNSPVVHVAFLAEQFKAITGDSKGFLLLHTFSVVPLFNRYSVKSQYLVDGKKSETVLSVSPLHISMPEYSAGFAQGNPTTSSMGIGSMMGGVVGVDGGWKLFNEAASQMDEGVVIFVTHKQALVVRLSPNFEPYDTLSKPEGVREGSLPYSSWRCTSRAPYKDESDSGIPWLTIAWDKKVQIIKLVKTKLERYSEWNLDSAAIGVSWLDDQMLVILTTRGHLCLFTKDGTEIHRASFTLDGTRVDDAIAYHTHFINSFGNPEKAYNNSFAVRGATAYIIGSSHLIIARLLPWKERIQLLQRAGDWMGALNMSLRLYDGQAHGVIDLPRQTDEIRKVIMPFLSELLYSYVDEVFSYISVAFSNQVGKTNQHNDVDLRTNLAHEELNEQFARVGGVAVEFCLHVNRTDILFDEIFSKFMAVHHGGTFLEVLEPYILKDMLSSLPPEIMQALVEHYSSKGWLQRVEQCVLHMEISSLDFNQIIKLCREHGLYGALIYLFNKGLDDYKTPLEELLTVVKNLPKADAISIGYRMLVYLKYCFLGLAFPPGHGSIPSSRQLSLTEELLQFLLENSILSSSPVMNTFKTTTGACPNFWFLLWLDVEATLDVLRLAFLDKVPSENAGDSTAERIEQPSEDQSSWSMAQKIVSSLIYLLDMESKETRAFTFHNNGLLENWPSKKDIGHVVDFIAFLVSCKQAVVSQQVVKHIMEYLTMIDLSSGENSQKSETKRKERQVVSLLNVLPEKDWNDSSLLNLFAEAHYYQACALIQTIRGQYIEALQSYMKDLHEPAYSFAFVHKMMLQLREPESLAFRAEVFSQLPELIKISREGAFFLVLDHFNVQATNILSELQLNSECLFLFLKTAIDVSLHGNLDFSALEISDASTVAFGLKVKSTPSDLDIYLERLSNFPKLLLRNPFHVTDEMVEQYLELLCQYESYSVLKFLKTFENYNLEHCLRLCQDHGITDAASFLLEMTGDVGGALAQAMSGLDENFLSIASTVQDTFQTVTIEGNNSIYQLDMFLRLDQVQNVFDVLGTSISLCQRNSPRLVPQESESLWFRLLDRFSEPLSMLCSNSGAYERANTTSPSGSFDRQIKNISRTDSTLKRLFSRFIKEIVEGMIGYVALPAIMNKLLTDNGDQEFGDFKFTILGMLGTYGFEKRILDAAKSLIEDDTFYTMNLLKRGASHAYAPQSSVCCICGCSLSKDATVSGIRIFNCGHSTHLHCEPLENETSHVIRLTGCPVCMPKKEISSSRTRSSKMDSALVQSSTFGGRSTRTAKNSHHFHEPEQIERPYSTHHVPRFEILNSLKNAQRRLIDATPQLRLAPPAIYHDKVQKGTAGLLGESSRSLVKSDRSNKRRQQTDTKSKSLSNHFPLKATIFGSERTRTTHRHSHRT